MAKIKFYSIAQFILLIFLCLGYSQISCASGEIVIQAPEEVARGDAFLVQARSHAPVEKFAFHWRGKTYFTKAEKLEDGTWQGQLLLPVPLDEKSHALNLLASSGKSNPISGVNAQIRLSERKRPVQKLNVDKKYVEPPEGEKERIRQDREKVARVLAQIIPERQWSLPFTRPVPGSISSLFGMKRIFNGQPRSVHKGLDLRGASGTPIKACADGQVVLVDNLYFSGNTVYINHGDGVVTAYLHMSEPLVQTGQIIKKGDIIGKVGATGRVTGPHLHLSLIVQGQSVDPEPLLEQIR